MQKVIIFTLVALIAPMSVFADDDADPQAESQPLTATVASVEGSVMYRDGSVSEDDSPWQDLEVGMELDEWTLILTGFDSQAVLSFPNEGEILIRASSMVGISEARQEGEAYQATVGLRYGSVRASVDHDRTTDDRLAVQTAVATAAPRGSNGDVGFSDFGAAFDCLSGFFLWYTQNGNTGVGGGQQSNGSNFLSALLDALQNDPVLADLFGGMNTQELLFHIQNGQGIFGCSNGGFGPLFTQFLNGHMNGGPQTIDR